MVKHLSYLFSAFSLLITTIGFCEPAKPYTIGAILPMTGEAANIGMFAKRSIELAYEELPPEQRQKIKIIFEDDGMDPKKSVAAFQMLSTSKGLDGVIAITSGIGHALAPVAERQGTVTVITGASDKTFAVGKEFIFIHWLSPEAEAEKLVQEIKRRGYKRIVMLSHIQQGVTACNEALMKYLKQEGLADRIVLDESFPIGSSDFKAVLPKVRAAKPDAIYLAMFSEGLSTISRRIKELSIPGEIFGIEIFEDEHVIKAAQGALNGAWYVNIDDPDKKFVEKYKSTYNGEYPGLAAANAYDTLHLFADAVSQFGHDNKKIASFFKTVKDYRGAAGTYSASGDNRFTLPAAVKIVKENGFEKISQ